MKLWSLTLLPHMSNTLDNLVAAYLPQQEITKVGTVNICDRCGAFGKEEVMTDLSLDYKDWEVCSACRTDFDTWMGLAANSRIGQAIHDKYVPEPKISEETRMLARVVAEEFARARDNAQKSIEKPRSYVSEAPIEDQLGKDLF